MPCQIPPRSNKMLSPGKNVCAFSASKDCQAFVGDNPESASSPVGDTWYVCLCVTREDASQHGCPKGANLQKHRTAG